jgi:hypothetical protein
MPEAKVPQYRQQESLNAGSKSSSMPAARLSQCRQQEFLNAGRNTSSMSEEKRKKTGLINQPNYRLWTARKTVEKLQHFTDKMCCTLVEK